MNKNGLRESIRILLDLVCGGEFMHIEEHVEQLLRVRKAIDGELLRLKRHALDEDEIEDIDAEEEKAQLAMLMLKYNSIELDAR